MARHMTWDLDVQDPTTLDSKKRAVDLMLDMLGLAGMKVLAGPYAINTGAYDPNPGVTGWTILTTSHVSIHTFLRQGKVFIDLFSCKDYDPDPISEAINRHYSPKRLQVVEVARAAMDLFQEEEDVAHITYRAPAPSTGERT